nr:AAA family ATPase [Pyrinomonadaceae bacterium]
FLSNSNGDGYKYFFNINNKFIKHLRSASNEFADIFNGQLDDFFQDTSKKIFKDTNFNIDFTLIEIKRRLNYIFSLKKKIVDGYMNISFDYDSQKILFDTEKYWKNASSYSVKEEILYLALQSMTSLIYPKPFLLPAERNAFIITYKMLANRRYKILRQTQRKIISGRANERQFDLLREQGDIRYPQPIEDFLDFLTDVELQHNAIEDSQERLRFHELANKIEINIQSSNKTQFKSTKFGGKEIKVSIKKGLDIDLYNASSSIKQLAPLLLYLRYRARTGDLLIVDEPEMNLHPESQAKLLEVLGMLVNAGVNVLLTTHSPYFMSHLNNLVSGKTDDENVLKEQAKSLYLGDERAFLKMEDVSAYEMKNNKLKDLKDKDYGIRWDTLSDVSADIQQKFFEIYEKGNETSAEDEM